MSEWECEVSIVLPCYREENFIEKGMLEISKVMHNMALTYEVIFVDDASPDNTQAKIMTMAEKFPNVKYILHAKNTGRGQAFIDGAMQARGNIIGFLDIDLEISVDCLPKVVKSIQSGNDVCIVKRIYKMEWNPEFILRHIASITYKRLVRIFLNLPSLDTESGFKFFRKDALFQLLQRIESKGWFFDTEIVALAYYSGMKIVQTEGIYRKNWKKASTVNLLFDSFRQFWLLVSYRKKLFKR
jgi:hypothetical protein